MMAGPNPAPSKGLSRRAGGPGILGVPSLSREQPRQRGEGERQGEARDGSQLRSGRDLPGTAGARKPRTENRGAPVLAGGETVRPGEPSTPPRLHHAKWTPRAGPLLLLPPPPPPARPGPARPGPARSAPPAVGQPRAPHSPAPRRGAARRRRAQAGGEAAPRATAAPRSPPPLYTNEWGGGRARPPRRGPSGSQARPHRLGRLSTLWE
ncbi:uncharacterized protein LOC142404265 [Mycteria americana]|uniref:uncharacterized protein LOC142404265 n=1 Tax=Mycteria americana TaxID=33587 RepID=UPI003F588F3B